MGYYKLWDLIIDQLWSYQDLNRILANEQAIADVFEAIAPLAGPYVPSLRLNNGATDGGAIYFDGGTTKFLKSDSGGDYLIVEGFNFEFTERWLYGDRHMLSFNIPVTSSRGSMFMSAAIPDSAGTVPSGYVMRHAGSVLSIAMSVYCNSAGGAGTSAIAARLYKNTTTLVNGSSTGAMSGGTRYGVKDTYHRDTYQFSANQRLEILARLIETGFGPTSDSMVNVNVEVVLDT